MNNIAMRDHLSELVAAADLSPDDLDGPSGSPERLVRLVLDGVAKLPLDRVPDVAAVISCDARDLFRAALSQFYGGDTIELIERMLGPQ
jgi:hypothetical protein